MCHEVAIHFTLASSKKLSDLKYQYSGEAKGCVDHLIFSVT